LKKNGILESRIQKSYICDPKNGVVALAAKPAFKIKWRGSSAG